MVNLRDDEQKKMMADALDAAVDRWMDKQFANFGKWTVRGILALIFGGAVWLYFHTGGLKP